MGLWNAARQWPTFALINREAMIKSVKISNFKSVQELEIELGRINVFIGENGCGKTSILEGIAMGAAAMLDRLSDEFLSSRGVRVTETGFMKSAFKKSRQREEVAIGLYDHEFGSFDIRLDKKEKIGAEWKKNGLIIGTELASTAFNSAKPISKESFIKHLNNEALQFAKDDLSEYKYDEKVIRQILNRLIKKRVDELYKSGVEHHPFPEKAESIYANFSGNKFMLYAPENHFLRNFQEEGQIRPLGIRGEGLFRHLVELSKEAPVTFTKIAEHLSLIDWFGGMSIPSDLQFTERRIAITDRFIADTIAEFDQRSANEGFLYLLFYFTLFLSKYTPKFFAIDNIDNALNPRLCAKLVEVLAKIAKEEDKQCILTTHNPAVLDGLDLEDDEQRLFVIYRNEDGETKARRLDKPKTIKGVTPVRLSEAFVRGYLGGLPTNF